jgi:hypothetical protein
VRVYGPINRSSQARTGRRDPETGEEIMRRVRPRMGGFREDPDWPLVAALEVFDDETQQARPAAIFHERVIDPPHERHGVDSPDEAVAVCLDETGTVTVERVAELLGTDPTTPATQLGELVYDEPGTNRLIPAAEYLSGNVRPSSTPAAPPMTPTAATAPTSPPWSGCCPASSNPTEITARLGAPWIPSRDIEQFCREVLDATVDVEHLPQLGHWSARLRDGSRRSVALSSEWGTAEPMRSPCSTPRSTSGSTPSPTPPTTAAGSATTPRPSPPATSRKLSRPGSRRGCGRTPNGPSRLAGRYNELFSSTVLPNHDGATSPSPASPAPSPPATTSAPRSPGSSPTAAPCSPTRSAPARPPPWSWPRWSCADSVPRRSPRWSSRTTCSSSSPASGFSSTRPPASSSPTASGSRRPGARSSSPGPPPATGTASCSPNPGSRGFPSAADLMPTTSAAEIATARAALAGSKDGKGLSVKKLERRIAQMEETYKRLLAEHTKDDGVRFEETGIDYLFVDEAHAYKNRRVDSSIDGVANTGSQRAQDLDSKLWALRRMHGPRVVTFATATPVANSMAELWVMQSYLQPDLLASVDLRAFDAWAANFGRTHTALELAPDGASYRMQTRFARFQNVPELLTLYRQVADVRTNDDLDLPVPALAGGQAETVVVEPERRSRRLRRRPRIPSRTHPQPGRRPERGQHVEGHRRRPPRRARPPTRR